MKVAAGITMTHNPFGEDYWASCLRENLTSSSYGEGLETGLNQVPRQSFTRQILFKELKSGLGLGEHQVTKKLPRIEKSLGIALIAYLLLLRARKDDIRPGKPWSIFQLKNNFTMELMTKQFQHLYRLPKILSDSWFFKSP
jgi:hypothetical protein